MKHKSYQEIKEEAFDICLKEMFLRVGLVYPDTEFTSDPEWYRKRTWTEQQEKDFETWMKKFLYSRFKRRGWTKKDVDLEVGMFLLNYGWKTDLGLVMPKVIKGD